MFYSEWAAFGSTERFSVLFLFLPLTSKVKFRRKCLKETKTFLSEESDNNVARVPALQPIGNVGLGFSGVGLLSAKCNDQTRLSLLGFQRWLSLSVRLISFFQLFLSTGRFLLVEKAKNLNRTKIQVIIQYWHKTVFSQCYFSFSYLAINANNINNNSHNVSMSEHYLSYT